MLEIIAGIGGFILPFTLGYLVIVIITNTITTNDAPTILFAGIGAGMGLSSLLYFISLLFHFPFIVGVFIEVASVVLLGFSLRKKMLNSTSSAFEPGNIETTSLPANIFFRILVAAFWIMLINTVIFYFIRAYQNPHGGGDAYHIWNLKARFLFASDPTHWNTIFSDLISYSHPDYPLLLPGFIGGIWTLVKNDSTSVPIITHFAFVVAVAGLIFTSLHQLKSKMQAYLATLFILCTPFFIISASNQFADLPLSFFFLGTTIFIFRAFTEKNNNNDNTRRHFIIIGLLASLSMWTKNEGVLFFFVVTLATFICSSYFRNIKEAMYRLLYFFIGAAPGLVLIIYFKFFLVPVNDLVASQGASTVKNMMDLSRYVIVFKAFISTGWTFGQWIISPVILAMLYGWMIGTQYNKLKNAIITASGIILLMLTGYFFTYINTYWELGDHLASSLDRLFMQLMPSVIFIYFALLQTPEDYLSRKARETIAAKSRI